MGAEPTSGAAVRAQLAESGWDGIGKNQRGAASNPPKPPPAKL